MIFLFLKAESYEGLKKEKKSELAGYLSISQFPRAYRKPVELKSIKTDTVVILYSEIDMFNCFLPFDMCGYSKEKGFYKLLQGVKDHYKSHYGVIY